jgi:hypothetical protein
MILSCFRARPALALAAILACGVVIAQAGDIDPPAGPVGPTMRTLDEVYDAAGAPAFSTADQLYIGNLTQGSTSNFLQIPNVTGASVDQQHQGWIIVHAVEQEIGNEVGLDLGAVRILAQLDAGFAQIAQMVDGNTVPASATLRFMIPTGGGQELLVEMSMTQPKIVALRPLFHRGLYELTLAPTVVQYTVNDINANGQITRSVNATLTTPK